MHWLSCFRLLSLQPTQCATLWRYLPALLFFGIAFGVRWVLDPALGERTPFGSFFIAVALATWCGGRGAGFLALALGFFGAEWFLVSASRASGVFSLNATFLITNAGYLLVGTIIVLSISGVRAAEARAKGARKNLETVLQKMPVGVLLAEAPSGKLTFYNEQAARICGDEFIARGCVTDLREYRGYHSDGSAYEVNDWPMIRSLSSGEVVTDEEVEFPLPDGGRLTLSINSAPIRDENGVIRAAVISFYDVSERKKTQAQLQAAQEKLSRHAESLEKAVAERTADLRGTLQSLEGVCYHIAHDLRAPLRSIQGFSTMLLETHSMGLSENEKDFIKRVGRSATQMDKLIQDLLEYGRLGLATLPCSWVDLNNLLNGLISQFSEKVRQAGATIEVRPALPKIWCNRQVLEQIVGNLLSNALKYVPNGTSPHVEIWAETNETECRIFVEDNGVGIAPEHQEKIFQVFERLEPAQELHPGTGIGLAIVRKGVQRMGGHIWLKSQPGRGSCFCISLPKNREREEENVIPPEPAENSIREIAPLHRA